MIAAVPTVFSRQVLSVTLHIYGQSTVKSRLFRRIFAVILTDNGSEFKHTSNKSLYEATTDKSIFRLMELMSLRGSCRFI